MDLLNGYNSSDSEPEESVSKEADPPSAKFADRRYLNAAPTPSILASVKANNALDRVHANSTALALRNGGSASNTNTNKGE